MHVERSAQAVRRRVGVWRSRRERIAFVPTMGSLHEGHLSLVRLARRHGSRVATSIFVNPAQFGPKEDFTRYPRDLKKDLRLLREAGADLCFVPSRAGMYRPGHKTQVRVTDLDATLEGASRPGHFAGVALVVLKLLHIVTPDVIVLGRKDAQQAALLSILIRDLDLPVRVVLGPTVREKDGLAMSSRNRYLAPDEREAARVLRRGLLLVADRIARGERSAQRLREAVKREFRKEPLARLDYVAFVDPRTLAPMDVLRGRVLVPVAAIVGTTRLIDNVEVRVPAEARGRPARRAR